MDLVRWPTPECPESTFVRVRPSEHRMTPYDAISGFSRWDIPRGHFLERASVQHGESVLVLTRQGLDVAWVVTWPVSKICLITSPTHLPPTTEACLGIIARGQGHAWFMGTRHTDRSLALGASGNNWVRQPSCSTRTAVELIFRVATQQAVLTAWARPNMLAEQPNSGSSQSSKSLVG